MDTTATHCALCWCELPAGEVAFLRLDGSVVCAACAFQKQEQEDARQGAYDDGR
jgi:uncharacterized Zn finger protein (UPF0148 family)